MPSLKHAQMIAGLLVVTKQLYARDIIEKCEPATNRRTARSRKRKHTDASRAWHAVLNAPAQNISNKTNSSRERCQDTFAEF